ncbi:sortase domain-bontaining protein [Hwanghaeella sp. 1Z406]|jgi:sortase A|uniref:sortase domain-containing protein n=1 Tax=Hwanghaeella sp. 1Z406 TaxID=3402811 RepID=UPI0026D3E60A|tara:strand:+ start:26821 stop:27438 length:618 start_codon:yes stop_codon:yes gene_type:complete
MRVVAAQDDGKHAKNSQSPRCNRPLLVLAIILAGFGVWQVGQSAVILVKAWLAPILIQRAWAAVQDGQTGDAVKPWPWADTQPIAKLHFPSLGRDRIALAGASPRAMAFGPTLTPGADVPAFFGHRDTHFLMLQDLQSGDPVLWEKADQSVAQYRVIDASVQHKDHLQVPLGSPGQYIALVTCWPFDAVQAGGPLRYVILAQREK